jgi:glyoxylase-like metal-dependent hydrolase (beta-lactamase superfamily II)
MEDKKIYSKSFIFSPFQENTYVLYNEKKEAVIIDPGMENRAEEEEIDSFIERNDLKVQRVLLTHAHIDHVFGLNHCVEKYNVSVAMHPDSIDVLKYASRSAELYGFDFSLGEYTIDILEEGDVIEFGLMVLFVPGHVPGHLVFYKEDQKEMWVGDVLFFGSIGRTDLPGGDHDLLIDGIKRKILTLDDHIVIHSGHGKDTTIGFERAHNPFL